MNDETPHFRQVFSGKINQDKFFSSKKNILKTKPSLYVFLYSLFFTYLASKCRSTNISNGFVRQK